MNTRRFTPWIVLACMGALAACTSGGGTAENTELNVIVPADPSGTGTPSEIDIETVEYTINGLGNSDVFLDNTASFPDEVRIDGNLEVVDGRPAPPGSTLANSEIWQAFMDLSPGPYTVQLRARDADGEVICTATEPFTVVADTTTKVDIVLICDISFQAPVGMLDVDGTFSFNVGNFCPDLFVLNCLNSDPVEAQVLPPPNPPLAATTCEVRFRDGDSTCGQNCDPQSCSPAPEGLTCKPGPDPGVSTTITCTNALLDCEGDGAPEPSCTINGDTLGTTASNTPIPCATDADCVAAVGPLPGIVCNTTTNTCDLSNTNPFLNLSFAVACIPPAIGGLPGAVIECTAVTTDGDIDCDKTKIVQVNCPGLDPCDPLATPPPPNCDDGQECTADSCDSSSGTAVCVNTNVANGTACTDAPSSSGLGVCLDGLCDPQGCTQTGCPDDGNDCTDLQTCNAVTELCEPDPPANTAAGTACAGDTGQCDGAGTCVDNCVGVDCSDGNDCTADVCDNSTNPGTCSNPFEPAGTACTVSVPDDGACDGAGTCVVTVNLPPQSLPITVGCSNNVTGDTSILTFTLDVDPGGVAADAAFLADLTGTAAFVESFLDAAQNVVPGGVRSAQLIDLAATVAVRSGATGADVELNADFAALDDRCSLTGVPCTGAPGQGDCTVIPIVSNLCTQGFATIPTVNGSPNSAGGCTQPAPGTPVPDCDCTPCEALDPTGCRPGDPDVPCPKGDQCTANGFCVAGDLSLPLTSAQGSYTAGKTGESMLFGWFDGLTPPVTPALLTLPAAVFANPPAPLGVRVSAGGLFVALQCLQAVDSGGPNGIATCQSGPLAGQPCLAPFDNSNNACNDGTDAGQNCSQSSVTACTFGTPATIGCVNADCGSDGGIAHECSPPDLASTTPDSLLNTFVVP